MNPPTSQAPTEIAFDFSIPFGTKFQVDRTQGVLKGMQILTGDREALGHGIWLDQRTVDTAAETLARQGGRMRGAITHGSLLGFLRNGGDRVMEVPGYFSGVRAVGNQLVGDFEFFESFRTEEPKAYARLMEMAEKTPDLVGLSAEPAGYLAYVAEDGTEHRARFDRDTGELSGKPVGVALRYGGLPAMRITRLRVAAFVDDPAATDGLFAKLSRVFSGRRKDELDTLHTIAKAVLAWSEKQLGPYAAAEDVQPAHSADLTSQTSDMKIFADIKAAFGANKAQHERAIALLAEDNTLTIEQIQVRLAAESHQVLVAERDQLRADLAARDTTIAAKDTEIASLQAQVTALKASGHPAPVQTGAAAGESTDGAKPLFGLERVAAHFAAQENNPANRAGRN
jgi:hypothetical protein